MHERFSEQVIASIIDDSRCGMSDVVFHTAPPIGGLSCFNLLFFCFQIEQSFADADFQLSVELWFTEDDIQ